MFDSLTASEPVAKMSDMGACRRNSVGKRKMPMRFVSTAVILAAQFFCNAALAQADTAFDGSVTPTPMTGATSPLGITSGSGASPAGIPLGSTEITSSGLSPVPTGVTGTITTGTITMSNPANVTACSTVGTSPSEMYGSTASFDGGGLAVGAAAPATAAYSGTTTPGTTTSGTATPLTTSVTSETPLSSGAVPGMPDTSGMSGACGSGYGSPAASSAPTSTSPTVPGGAARTGIPLGSFEIGNLGVGSTPAVPLPSVLPLASTMAPVSPAPTLPTLAPATSSTTASSNPACASPGSGAVGVGNFAGEGNAGVIGTSLSARLLRQSILCQRP
jgi:hypothetical protein